jgi:hypothetical protein
LAVGCVLDRSGGAPASGREVEVLQAGIIAALANEVLHELWLMSRFT